MNGSSIQPERAWQMALDQLRLDMPKASFDTRVLCNAAERDRCR